MKPSRWMDLNTHTQDLQNLFYNRVYCLQIHPTGSILYALDSRGRAFEGKNLLQEILSLPLHQNDAMIVM